MQKSYLLLRNNQQSGPYSLEELVGMALQAKDLVWIIGQSAGWRYPEEIEAIKTHIGIAHQSPTVATLRENTALQQHTSTAPAEKAGTDASRHIYVSLPSKPVKTSTEQIADTPTLSFEERVEKLRQRVAHVETTMDLPQESEVKTKYSRSLEDIKAEYSGWMNKQMRKRKIDVKQIAITASLFLGVIVGVWAVYNIVARSSANESVTKDQRLVEFHPTPVQPTPIVKANKAKQNSKRSNRAGQQSKPNNLLVKNTKTEKANGQTLSQNAIDGNVAIDKKDNSPRSVTEKQTATKTEKAAAVVDQLQLHADYIADNKSQQGVGGLEVAIKNNSNQMMKVVAVDVVYYGEGMEEIDRKTLYFSDLQPGQTLTRKAPAHKKAEGAYAQLGLISSEAGNIFYASN